MNRPIVVLGAATLVFGSASAYLYNDLRETRSESAALQTRVDQLENATLASARHIVRNPETPRVNPFGPPTQVATESADARPARKLARPAPPPPAGQVASVAALGTAPGAAFFRSGWDLGKLMENPEYRDAMKRQRKLMMSRMYPDVRAALQLDDQQADQLFDVLTDQQMQSMSLRPPSASANTAPDPAAMREWQAQHESVQRETDAALVTLLGDAGVQQWKNYQATLPARAQVRELRSSLEGAGLTLQQDQAERLVAALAAEQQRSAAQMQPFVGANSLMNMRSGQVRSIDRVAMSEQMLERQKQQQQSLRAAVAPILTSQQLRQLERQQAAELEMAEINMKMAKAQAEAEGRGETTGISQNVSPLTILH